MLYNSINLISLLHFFAPPSGYDALQAFGKGVWLPLPKRKMNFVPLIVCGRPNVFFTGGRCGRRKDFDILKELHRIATSEKSPEKNSIHVGLLLNYIPQENPICLYSHSLLHFTSFIHLWRSTLGLWLDPVATGSHYSTGTIK